MPMTCSLSVSMDCGWMRPSVSHVQFLCVNSTDTTFQILRPLILQTLHRDLFPLRILHRKSSGVQGSPFSLLSMSGLVCLYYITLLDHAHLHFSQVMSKSISYSCLSKVFI